MKSARLLRLIGEVDSKFVDVDPIEDCLSKKRSCSWVRWVSLAACLVIAVSCGIGLFYVNDNNENLIESEVNVIFPDKGCHYSSKTVQFCLSVKQPYDFSAISKQANMIVVADVIATTKHDLGETVATVKIREVLKGQVAVGEVIKIVDNVVGDGVTTDGGPALKSGNRILTFLKDSALSFCDKSERYYTYVQFNLGIGKFYYDRDESYHASITYSELYPSQYCDAMFADYTPKTLEEIKELI